MAKKKKRSAEETHRQIQDSVQALPLYVAQLEKEGKRGKAFVVRYISGPILRVMNRIFNAQRYRGPEGAKRKQSEQMKRHLDQRRKAVEYMQGEMQKAQKKQKRTRR